MKTAQEMAAVMMTWKPGQKWQVKPRRSFCTDGWTTLAHEPTWKWDSFDYRQKPEPKLRAWKPEEVPLGAWFRYEGNPECWCVIFSRDETAIRTPFNRYTFREALEGTYKHSTDNGVTWHPCGIMEDAQ